MNQDQILAIEAEHAENPGARAMQKALAADVTKRIHGEGDLNTAIAATALLFGKSTEEDLRALPESELLSVFEGVPQREVSRSDLAQGMGIIDMLAGGETPFLSSGGDARRALKENSVSVNRNKVGPDHTLTTQDAIGSGIILIQRGKKNHYLVRITG
jgi:tyrosyl-tRNA synthetase